MSESFIDRTGVNAACSMLKPCGLTYQGGRWAGQLFFLKQILPRREIGDRHTEGLPVCLLPEFFIMRPDFGVCHRLAGVEDRLGETLAVCLLRLAPLDV